MTPFLRQKFFDSFHDKKEQQSDFPFIKCRVTGA
jgi:hypothetical protein